VQFAGVAGARQLDPLGFDRLIACHHVHTAGKNVMIAVMNTFLRDRSRTTPPFSGASATFGSD